MRASDVVFLLVILAVGTAVWCFVLRLPPCRPEPVVKDADAVEKLDLSCMPKKQEALPRPLIEYPNAAFTRSLIESTELEEKARVLSRPLTEYPNSAISFALKKPQTSPATLPRLLVEYSDSAIVFTLEQPTDADLLFARVRPRPLVEYADAGWSGSLSPPGLLKGEE